MEGNNAPFSVGQRIIAVKDGWWKDEHLRIIKAFSKGDEFTVLNTWYCCMWRVDIGHKYEIPAVCHSCGLVNGHALWAPATMFAPIQHQYTDISKELADGLPYYKEEVPDKVLVPETVNN